MKMTKLAVLSVALLGFSSAFANTQIATDMKEMSTALRTITAQVSNAADNASSAALCDQIIAGIGDAETQTPDDIAKLPAASQPAQELAYVALLDTLAGQVAQLKTDFLAGNNAAAVTEIAAINATKTTGHGQFNQ
jgi:hypothetical protein